MKGIRKVRDEALAGLPEGNISWHFPTRNNSRRIYFKGHYLAIDNEIRGQYATHNISSTATTEHEKFELDTAYT